MVMLKQLRTFFQGKDSTATTPQTDQIPAPADNIDNSNDHDNDIQPLTRQTAITRQQEKQLYKQGPSLIDYLPWVEYLPEAQCLLLDDGVSVAAVYQLTVAGTEGRTDERIEEIRDITEDALQDCLDERDVAQGQWVVQFYCQDEAIQSEIVRIRDYIQPHARGSQFTQCWLTEMERHLASICTPDGLFTDTAVTGVPWRGQIRRTRMVVYRYVTGKSEKLTPQQHLNQVCDRLSASLSRAGIFSARQNGAQIHDWLLRFFNPGAENEALYRYGAYHDSREDPLPVAENDFAETLFFSYPRDEDGIWWFGGMAHQCISVERLRRAPEAGHLTAEKYHGENINTHMDLMPPGTISCLSIVVQPQDVLEAHFSLLHKRAMGENVESEKTREDVVLAKAFLGERHKLYRTALSFIIRAESQQKLHQYHLEVSTTLSAAGLIPMNNNYDIAPLSTLLRALPACYNPATDTKNWYTRLTFVQHAAALAPVYGRSTGTGHPGISFFNRGGEPLDFDPIADKTQNAHLLLFGPTGAGKSASLCAILCQMMAVHRPRLFLVEAGNSFGLLADYYASLGLTVNKISIKPGQDVRLPLFADSHLLFSEGQKQKSLSDNDELPDLTDDDGDDTNRDILGEMEIAAILMITGGSETLNRADRGLLRRAIMIAAQQAYDEQRQMLPHDLQKVLEAISVDNSLADSTDSTSPRRPRWHPTMQARASEMALALELISEGFEGQLFNREGQPWPEADVTIVDLGHLAREGYESQMALAVISLFNMVNTLSERDQYKNINTLFAIDEAHIITANRLVAPYAAKITKMWRKLGTWLWLATQNLKDYPDIAEKMLNMAEWWVCLTMPPDEVENIARFRSLTEEEKSMMLSATKQRGAYTEGVILAKKWQCLFRAVPPSLYLALGMTEKDEKAQRRELMKQHNCTELEAAFLVAQDLDKKRGLAVAGAL